MHAYAAAGPEHKVEIVAPPELAKLLQANLDIVHWSARPDVTADQLAQLYLTAPEQIKTLLATEGYFSPSVESSLEESPLKWLAKFTVTPGQPTKVSSVQIDFSGAVMGDPNRDERLAQARKAFTIKPGDIFRQSAWDEAKAGAVKSLASFRYATAHVTASRAEIDPQAHTARLSVQIDSGPPVTFGAVRIKGQKRYPEQMIANLNPIHAGDP